MPDPSLLSPTGLQMLSELPPQLRGSYDYMAVVHAYAREIDLAEAAIEQLRAQMNPATADILLPAWESTVKLPVGGNGADIPTRRAAVIARLQKVLTSAEGTQWISTLDSLIGPGWSYTEGNGIIDIILPQPSGSATFDELVEQIRNVTPAHLELSITSSSAFQLDISEMDIQDLGN